MKTATQRSADRDQRNRKAGIVRVANRRILEKDKPAALAEIDSIMKKYVDRANAIK